MAMTYGQYLKVNELLDLQKLKSENEHDEMLFIIIHQVYELWFKQVLHECGKLQQDMPKGDAPNVLATMKRVLTILKVMVSQVDVLETMTPRNFLTFRDRLENSSGFQSYQFRKFEYTLGKRDKDYLKHYDQGSIEHRELMAALEGPTLFDSFLAYLGQCGHKVPDSAYSTNRKFGDESPELQDVLMEVYKSDMNTTQLCERLVDLDEGIQEWRYRHVMMVQRTIGTKMGSGGSSGVEYLKSTLFKPFFPDLWAIRSRF